MSASPPKTPLTTLQNAMVPATVGVGSGVVLSLGVTDGAADGEFDAVLLEPPQAASASTASTTSSASALATIVDDPRFP